MPWFSTMANGYYVLLDYDGRPKPTMMAYSALDFFLGDAKPVEVVRRDGLRLPLFARSGGTVAVAWTTRNRRMSPRSGVSAYDLMGSPLTSPGLDANEPFYLLAPHLSPARLRQSFQDSLL